MITISGVMDECLTKATILKKWTSFAVNFYFMSQTEVQLFLSCKSSNNNRKVEKEINAR